MSENVAVEVSITSSQIESDSAAFSSASDGAVVSFLGVVRGSTEDRIVDALEYEAYDDMAVREMEKIAEAAVQRWGVTKIRIVHRVGRLAVGDVSVAILVAAPHRAEAFEACRFCIETLKAQVPIWKKEIFTDGESHWVEHP